MAQQEPGPPAYRLPRGPLYTLGAGIALAIVLAVLSVSAASDETERSAAVAAEATTVAPPPEASTPPAPPPTAEAAVDTFRAAYAGKVDGDAATLAIAIRDGSAIAYLCDGKTEAWLRGPAQGGKLSLTGVGVTADLAGTFDQNVAAGEVTAGRQTYTWRINVAKKPSGLYRSTAEVRNARVVTGWIVLSNGEQVGVSTSNGRQSTAPRLDVASRSARIDGTRVTAESIDGTNGNGF